jgi:biopolymer transport protein ExbD
MMRLPDPAPPRRPEALLPMIDVVFFLIVFFMMVSTFSAPEPFAVDAPQSATPDPASGEFGLWLSAAGVTGFVGPAGVVQGDAALVALAQARDAHCAGVDCAAQPPVLLLHADAAAPGGSLASVMARLGQAGFANVTLVTVAE